MSILFSNLDLLSFKFLKFLSIPTVGLNRASVSVRWVIFFFLLIVTIFSFRWSKCICLPSSWLRYKQIKGIIQMQISKGWLTSPFHIWSLSWRQMDLPKFQQFRLSFIFSVYLNFMDVFFFIMANDEYFISAYWYTDVLCWLKTPLIIWCH